MITYCLFSCLIDQYREAGQVCTTTQYWQVIAVILYYALTGPSSTSLTATYKPNTKFENGNMLLFI